MKDVWPTKKLEDVCEVFADGDWIESKDQSPEGIRLIQTGNVGEGLFKDRSDKARYISAATFKRLRCTEIFEGDCLISRLPDPVGRSCILPNTNERMITAVDCTIVRFRLGEIVPAFFNYYSLSDEYLNSVASETTGTTRDRISRGKLGQVLIPVPPIPEQERIIDILDQAFDNIGTARANAERNLENARGLFESHLRSVFSQRDAAQAQGQGLATDAEGATRSRSQSTRRNASIDVETDELRARLVTKTGGRKATLRHIPGELSLAVGMPKAAAKEGWGWTLLADLARLESGHTPSRRHTEYWGGPIPWIGIQDARENHGQRIAETSEHTNALGIANSSARVLPENTVCLSRTASVGYVVVMARPMATSQDFVNWVCSGRLNPDFLKYLFLAEGRDGFLRYASGAIHQTIYFPEAKAFCVCHPGIDEQIRIVRQCDALHDATQHLESIYRSKLAALDALEKSLLHEAFSGALRKHSSQSIVLPFPTRIPDITSTDLHAGILATAYDLHEKASLQMHFGHVKAEKIAHMVEASLGIDLGRAPIKDAAGPNDYPRQLSVEHRARKAGYFDFKRVGDAGYRVKKLRQFTALIERTREKLGVRKEEVDKLLALMLPMNTQQAEIFATVYAAWNNLLLDGQSPTDEQIVVEARENWHPEKMRIPREKFFKAIEWIREKDMVPGGKGRKVAAKAGQ